MLVLLLMIGPFAALAVVNYQNQGALARQRAFETSTSVARVEALRQEAVLGSAEQLVTAAAIDPAIRAGGPACNQTLAEIRSALPVYSNLFVTDSGGALTCSALPTAATTGDRDYFLGAKETGKLTVGGYLVSRVTGHPIVVVAYPLQDGAGFAGIVAAAVDLEWLAPSLQRAANETGTLVVLMDANGIIMARTERSADFVGQPAPYLSSLLGHDEGLEVATGLDNVTRYYAYHAVQDSSGRRVAYLAVGQPIEAVQGPIDATFQTQMLTFGAIALGGLLLTWTLSSLTISRTHRALRTSEELYRFLTDNIADLVVAATPDGKWTYVSPSVQNLLGYEAGELVGITRPDILHPDDVAPWLALKAKVVAETTTVEHEFRFRRKDGTYVWVESKTTALQGASGNVTGLISLVRDATKRHAAAVESGRIQAALEEGVKDRTAELAAANKELEAFAYSVSHDLRAPLRSLDGFSKILLEEYRGALPPEGQHYLQMVIESAAEMAGLVEAILQFSRAGRQDLQRQPVEPRDVVNQVLEMLKPAMAGREIHVNLGELPATRADPTLLRQVYANLLSNAVKFTKHRAMAIVEIGSLRKDGETVYFVKDNGAGFDMNYAGKLFGIFQRLHPAAEFEGNGVGLAIVKRIVERHGGRVWAEGQVDKGAQFYFTIPGGRKP